MTPFRIPGRLQYLSEDTAPELLDLVCLCAPEAVADLVAPMMAQWSDKVAAHALLHEFLLCEERRIRKFWRYITLREVPNLLQHAKRLRDQADEMDRVIAAGGATRDTEQGRRQPASVRTRAAGLEARAAKLQGWAGNE